MYLVEDLLARAEITDVLCRYAHAIDRGNRELARTCYHPDATDDHGRFSGTVDELFEFFRSYGASLKSTYHFLGVPTIVREGTRAEVETYCLYRKQPIDGAATFQGLRYVDVFEQRNGRWLVASRTVVLDWEHAAPPDPAVPSPDSWRRGARGDADPAAAVTRALADVVGDRRAESG
ncbi:nuclear transport factor 2 family protein [Prauserella halophila]|uniref:Nuclear transport factor 2 family protein n=1 Tax=Prauserella halophila TaxID=185641 RepID=A0ABP4H5H1_9PSEU|nr:nuclear transport factor 2 family protein [Prauserella halophila]MCP2238180.1 SnoaL-like domain-containing protein [Prauserella halophila]